MASSVELLATAEELLQMGIPQKVVQIGQQLADNAVYRPQALQLLGRAYCHMGDFAAAITALAEAHQLGLQDAETLFWLGNAFLHQNQFKAAEKWFQQLVNAYPHDPRGWIYLGLTLMEQQRFQQAIHVMTNGQNYHPDNSMLQAYLGGAYYQNQQYEEAYRLLYRVVHDSQNVLGDWTLTYLAHTCRALIRTEEAFKYYQQALEINPNNLQALNNLGILLVETHRAEEALPIFKRLVTLDDQVPVYWFNYGNAYRALGQLTRAAQCYRTALQREYELPEAHYNLAKVLTDIGQFDEAEHHFRQAIALKPDLKEAWINLIYVLQETGQVEGALQTAEVALQRFPENRMLRWNRCIFQLLLGRYQDAWPDYELRLQMGQTRLQEYPFPRWQGEDISDKTLLIHNDQGLGDAIQFFRFLKVIRHRVGRLILAVPRPLVRLLAHQAVADWVVPEEEPVPSADFELPIGSLPGLLNVSINDVAVEEPYLTIVDDWLQEVPDLQTFSNQLKIGIVWRGNPRHTRDRDRSCSLQLFAPLAEIPHIQLFSLQKGAAEAEINQIDFASRIIPLGSYLHDLANTAALIHQLDLVVSVDTSVAHLAAAMGKPTWILIQYAPDWRWLLHRPDSPWYPAVRLFRQQQWRNWDAVIQQVVDALQKLVERELI